MWPTAAEQLGLGGEVVLLSAPADAGLLGYLDDGRGGVAMLDEALDRRIEEGGPVRRLRTFCGPSGVSTNAIRGMVRK